MTDSVKNPQGNDTSGFDAAGLAGKEGASAGNIYVLSHDAGISLQVLYRTILWAKHEILKCVFIKRDREMTLSYKRGKDGIYF